MLPVHDPSLWLREYLINAGLGFRLSTILSTAGLTVFIVFLAWLSNLIAKTLILQVVTRIVKKTTSTWDDVFLEQKVFTRLSHFAPALVIWFMAGWALEPYPVWLIAAKKLIYVYMVLVGTFVVSSFVESWHQIYLTLPISQHRHIKGYVQIVKLFVYIIAVLIIISAVFGRQVGSVIAGLGAMAAVLTLIFKDAILGLVASIQLSANNMLKIGDWITIPSRGVDGITEDITLTTVKVRNFDRTIITIPAYALVNESFQNWKGMETSGIRQIKRSIFIDLRSIKYPDRKLKEKLAVLPALKNHLKEPETDPLREKGITNLGLFRIYAESYLNNHPMIDKNNTVIVKDNEPGINGLPVQVYAFCNNNSWVPYEKMQSEIFEHLIAVLNVFDLRVFQQPAGDDFLRISATK